MAGTLTVQNIQGPASGANANKIIIPSGQTLDIDSWTPPAGTVLQVVQGTQDVGTGSITSSSFVNTGLSVSITPTSANSKILVIHSGNFNTQSATSWADLTLYRDISSTLTHLGYTNGFNGIYGDADDHTSSSINYLDSPNTTSSVVYRIYIKSRNGTTGVRFNPDGHRTTLIAMEIAG